MVEVIGKILLKGAPEVTIVDESESTPGMSRQITGFRQQCEPYLYELLSDATEHLNKDLPGSDNPMVTYDVELMKVVGDMSKFAKIAKFVFKVFNYEVTEDGDYAGATLNMTFEPCEEDGDGN